MNIGQDSPPIAGSGKVPYLDPAGMQDQEQSKNEHTFGQLQAEYEETSRAVNFLSNALHSAQTRESVLGAAMNKLNEPQQAQTLPSGRG